MKKINLLIVFTALLLFSISHSVQGQAFSSEDIKIQMLKDWERAKSYTVDYLNAMPADKYNFRPTDSVRSFAQQMLHLAGVNVFLIMTAANTPPPSWLSFSIESRKSAHTKDSVMFFITASYDYCSKAIQNYDVNKWGEPVKTFNYTMTRFALMNKAFEHQTHHRGQTTIYIRENGITPPPERLFD